MTATTTLELPANLFDSTRTTLVDEDDVPTVRMARIVERQARGQIRDLVFALAILTCTVLTMFAIRN